MRRWLEMCVNPFVRLAGMPALAWGLVGLLVSVVLGILSGYHYHGLLHFGPVPNSVWWCFVAERLAVWLVPALLCLVGGQLLSRSHIRAVDVFGTVLFSQVPLVGMNLVIWPSMDALRQVGEAMTPAELAANPEVMQALLLSLLGIPFLLLMLVWMYHAVKLCCNLKGARLWGVLLVTVLGGDALCRMLIGWLYKL